VLRTTTTSQVPGGGSQTSVTERVVVEGDGFGYQQQRRQGLTLVHFSAHLERSLWDRGGRVGVVWPMLMGCLGVFWGV
jgi:hypothetical protein